MFIIGLFVLGVCSNDNCAPFFFLFVSKEENVTVVHQFRFDYNLIPNRRRQICNIRSHLIRCIWHWYAFQLYLLTIFFYVFFRLCCSSSFSLWLIMKDAPIRHWICLWCVFIIQFFIFDVFEWNKTRKKKEEKMKNKCCWLVCNCCLLYGLFYVLLLSY